MASVFNSPTFQHMEYTNKAKFNTMQSDVANQSDYNLLGTSLCISDIVKRMSPDVGAKSPKHNMNLSLILDEFLPWNEKRTKQATRRRKNYQYKPVVLRNKTPFSKLSPEILLPQHYNSGDETNTLRVSKTYTLPHNKDTDVLEIMPTGDSSIYGYEEKRDDELPLSHIMLNMLNRICLQSCLNGYSSSLQYLVNLLHNCGAIRALTSSYDFLYDLIIKITITLRQTIPNTLTRLRQHTLVEPIAVIWRCLLEKYSYLFLSLNNPFVYDGKLNSLHLNPVYLVIKRPSNQNLPCQPIEELLSRSTILSFGRFCNFDSLMSAKLKC